MQKMGESHQDRPSICIIGAGFSGLCAALQLKRQLKFNNFIIIDKNNDFGGVWWSNRYPGCASDVIGHLYSLSFEPNPDWSKGFVPQLETLDYITKVARKYDLYKNALFRHKVERLEWDDPNRKWRVFVNNSDKGQRKEMTFDIIISGQGRYTSPKIPDMFSTFENPIIHSAAWNDNVALDGKKVAVIGTGSTGAQLIPSIAPRVEKLTVFIRHPPYIVPPEPVTYSPFKKLCFKYIPFLQRIYRGYLFLQNEKYFAYFAIGSKMNLAGKAFCQFWIHQQIIDKKLAEEMVPDYSFGCKRIIPSLDFYPALNRKNVSVVRSPILKVEEKTLFTEDGQEIQPDVLILATGFNVQDTYGTFQLIGRDGVDIHKMWSEDKPSAYLATMTSYAPNYFILLGPNTANGYNTVLFSLECQVNWMIQVIRKIIWRQSKNSKVCVSVLPSVEVQYMKELHEKMKGKIYSDPSCGTSLSWFRNSSGQVTEMYPDTSYSFWKKTFWLDENVLEFR